MRTPGPLRTLLRYELLMLLRDTRTLLIAVFAPLLLFPAILGVHVWVERSEERRTAEATHRYAVVGARAEEGRALVRAALGLPPPGPEETGGSRTPRDARFEERPAPEADSLPGAEGLDVVVRILSAPDGVPVVRLEYRASSDRARIAADELYARLAALRSLRRDSLYRAAGLGEGLRRFVRIDRENVASAGREGGALLGVWLTPLLLFLMLTGGSIVAADAISGEKERGTLETLLTTSVRRSEIVAAKQLAVLATGLAVALINILNLVLYVVLGLFDLPDALSVALDLPGVALLLVLFLPLSVLVSSALLLLSGYAGSYKEYQIYFFPLLLALVIPSLAAALPGMELRSAVALVPISGVGVAVREVMAGGRDWIFLLIAFASTAGAAVGVARLTERTLSTERLLLPAGSDDPALLDGPARFRRHVLRWFAVLWAVFFVTSLWLGDELGLRSQLAVNLVGIFLGGSLLMLQRYRLPVREALALRRPHPAAWLAVVIGAPSAFVIGIGIAQAVNTWLFPVPEQVLEAFGEFVGAADLPLWQTLVFLAVLPGILEEVAFRGLLLHGLRRALRPLALCAVVGGVFGLFHVSLFRILPTAYLGVVLAGVVLLSGSLLPAMLWHALNNAAAIVPTALGWVGPEAVPPAWLLGAGATGLAAAFWILWRTRRPYPGVRGWTAPDSASSVSSDRPRDPRSSRLHSGGQEP